MEGTTVAGIPGVTTIIPEITTRTIIRITRIIMLRMATTKIITPWL